MVALHSLGQRLLPWVAAAVAGVVLALALPGLQWWPLVLVFPGLLLAAVDGVNGTWSKVLIGLFAGIVHWCVAAFWVVAVMHDFGGLSLVLALVCLLLMGLIPGSSWAVVTGLCGLVRPVWRPWLLACGWSAMEAARQLPPYLFPWNSTAACFTGRPELLASLPWWGATGLGWCAVMVGASLYVLVRGPRRRVAVVVMTVVVGTAWLLGVLAPDARTCEQPIRVAALQPGTQLDEKWDPSLWPQIMDRVWRLSRQAAEEQAQLILWPESAVPLIVERDSSYRASLVELAAELKAALVVNSVGTGADGKYFNSVYVVHPDGIAESRYDKVRLVPFGEYVPAWAKVAFTESLVREVGSFTAGSETVLLDGGTELGVALCYEVIFADLVAGQVRAGAKVLTTVTNDGWYGDSWAPPQHFAQAVLRAAESRRFMVRAALTGISAVIDPHGVVVERLDVGEGGYVVASVQPCDGVTWRSRLGDWWAVLCVLSCATMVVLGRRRKVEKNLC